jgi:hypothetical protein
MDGLMSAYVRMLSGAAARTRMHTYTAHILLTQQQACQMIAVID